MENKKTKKTAKAVFICRAKKKIIDWRLESFFHLL
jgi:hypothetical protein